MWFYPNRFTLGVQVTRHKDFLLFLGFKTAPFKTLSKLRYY